MPEPKHRLLPACCQAPLHVNSRILSLPASHAAPRAAWPRCAASTPTWPHPWSRRRGRTATTSTWGPGRRRRRHRRRRRRRPCRRRRRPRSRRSRGGTGGTRPRAPAAVDTAVAATSLWRRGRATAGRRAAVGRQGGAAATGSPGSRRRETMTVRRELGRVGSAGTRVAYVQQVPVATSSCRPYVEVWA